ncbi:hypothetical protein M407DRAFT_23265 [Tulasnella calospora MUT 4182]|uniref:GPI anchored protein n=1 Tax=Tulasnella calospora MUT 4182 TaxID=1051891 RepID=A0A0C3QJU0_9AGAM|nr:hypothetical protein M407DRAFT_23265 [Tulasnella calospora MUT 4182]
MLARAIIHLALLFAGEAIADQVHKARDVTTEVVIAVTDGGTTRLTTITSIITPTYVPNATYGIPTSTEISSEDLISTHPPIDTSTACYCYIPVTTGTTEIQTLTVHGPTPTTMTVTVIPASPDTAATRTICPCEPSSTNYVSVPTTNAGVIPTTQSVAAAAVQETSGVDDSLLLNANGAVPGATPVHLVGVATFLGLVGAGAMFL